MKIFLILSFLVLAVSAVPSVDKYKSSMETILKAIGTPDCVKKCINPLLDRFYKIWDMKNLKDHSAAICKAFDEAERCLEKDAYCDYQQNFKKAASGLRHRCVTQARNYDGFQQCVNPHLDRITQKCDNKCGGRQSVINYAQKDDIQTISKYGGNTLIAAGHVKELCASLSCIIPCLTNELNYVCPRSGYLALESIMQPFEAMADGVDSFGPTLKSFIYEKMDSKCLFIVNTEMQKKIKKGDFSDLK